MEYLVAGLGNIGSEYSRTRHNMGFMVLDAWAQASNAVFSTKRYGSIAKVTFKGRNFTLLKPSTYMNLSGNAVDYWVKKMNIPLENLIVVCDDLNLPFGMTRMKLGGSSGGHNGLWSVEDMLETDRYCRIRIGIGSDFSRGGQIDFVLGDLSEDEMKEIPQICERVIEGIKAYSTVGPQRAMNSLNTRQNKANALENEENK